MVQNMQTGNGNNGTNRVRINGFIRAQQVQVIGSSGENLGTMDTWRAIALAQSEGLDLIEINPKNVPPICRIADHGKLKYAESKKQKEAKKKQKNLDMKQLEIRPSIEIFDINHKIEKAKEFLIEGHRVKLVCKFRGREMAHREIGSDKLLGMLEQLKDLIGNASSIGLEGKDMSVIIAPKTNK